MKITYDVQADALYIELHALAPGTATCRDRTEEIVADYGPDGRLAGLGILDASVLPGEEPQRMVLDVAPSLAAKSALTLARELFTPPICAAMRFDGTP